MIHFENARITLRAVVSAIRFATKTFSTKTLFAMRFSFHRVLKTYFRGEGLRMKMRTRSLVEFALNWAKKGFVSISSLLHQVSY